MQTLKKYDNTDVENLLQLSDLQSGDGWIKFPEGTMIQYGNRQVPAQKDRYAVNFNQAFVGGYFVNTTCCYLNFISCVYTLANKTNLTFDVYPSIQHSANSFDFIAIGRWK